MLVDTILKWYGRNPGVYPTENDKWIVIFSESLLSSYIYLPFIFALLPWVYFLIKRKNHIKDKKKFTQKVGIVSVVGFLLGCMMPFIVLGIAASLAARSLYGG